MAVISACWRTLLSCEFWNDYSSRFVLVTWLFFRGLALIYLSAFASMAVQIEGLLGSEGILPATSALSALQDVSPLHKLRRIPSLFWLDASDTALIVVCYIGMGAALLLLLNRFSRAALITCYLLYLSIVAIGQDFMLFQWDVFLLEIGFLAILLTWGSAIIVLLYRWLLARFMFMGGVVKLASGDPTWANLTALNYHYQTQPLPSPLAYYAYHLSEWFHKLCVGGVFFIELVVPFLVFFPRPFRLFAGAAFVALQGSIIATGNYNFFNLVTILLCLFLLEDRDLVRLFPWPLKNRIQWHAVVPGNNAHRCAAVWSGVVMLVCGSEIWSFHSRQPVGEPLQSLLQMTSSLSLVNNYGPFAVMTTERDEIIVQGSNDGVHWADYQFKYKPGALEGPLSWNIPHQPRLDWQMWFAALAPARRGSWFESFLLRLLQGSPEVLALLENNPFPDEPPRHVRALLYRYEFTSPQQRAENGQIWRRQYLGIYWPMSRL